MISFSKGIIHSFAMFGKENVTLLIVLHPLFKQTSQNLEIS